MNNKKAKIISYVGFFFIIGALATVRAVYVPDGILKILTLIILLLVAWGYSVFVSKKYDIALFSSFTKQK